MEYRNLEISVISAKDLKNVNFISKMDVYVVVSISGDNNNNKQQKTNVDRDGNTHPTWNFPMKFTVNESAVQQNRVTLVFKLRCERALGDKDIGEVHVPVKELLDTDKGGNQQFVSYQVRKPSGKPKGELNFSCKFGEKVSGTTVMKKVDEPVTAYPAVGPSSAYPPPPPPVSYMEAGTGSHSYPPPPPQGGYQVQGQPYSGYPPPAGYGYPPPPPPQSYGGYPQQQQPPPGYGYPPQPGYGYPPVQQPPKKNKFGLGLGAGLLGGALGGLLIGDMVSDSYDGGYDGGFGDGGFGDGGF